MEDMKMDLYRKIEEELNVWKSMNSALILYGARQVGKTYTLKKFIENKIN